MRGLIKRFGLALCLAILVMAVKNASAAPGRLPVVKGKSIVAMVNEEPVTLNEYNRELASLRQLGTREGAGHGVDGSKLLQRLVNAKLVVQEGRRLGLDELPEVRDQVDVFARVTLREHLAEKQTRHVKALEKEVERLYQASTVEWKLSSLLFEKEADAQKMIEELQAGKEFEELSKKAVEAKTAKQAGQGGQYIKVKEISPEIAGVVSKLKPGSVTPVIPLKSGYAVVRLEDIRHSDNPEEKERARYEALQNMKVNTLKDYIRTLLRKYVRVHKGVLDQIDYESQAPGLEQLLRDERAVADIKGEAPITVRELTSQLKQQFYHGVDRAIESKKLNARKVSVLDDMLYKRVFRKEALRLGLDKTDSYRNQVSEYENSLIFGIFVQKAVVPDVKLTEDELKAYYQQHITEYTFPEMMRIDSLAYEKRADAEAGIEKLRKGTDFQWLSANAEGQVDKKSKGLLVFDGKLLTTADLPEGMRKVISGAKAGDLKLYAAPEGYFYALLIQQVVPSTPRPYEEAREEIAKKIFNEKLKQAMDEWTAKLRAAAEIKIYLSQ